jgi:hypothetical protein
MGYEDAKICALSWTVVFDAVRRGVALMASMVYGLGNRWEGRKEADGERYRRRGLYTCNMRLHSLVLEPLQRHTWIFLRVWNIHLRIGFWKCGRIWSLRLGIWKDEKASRGSAV